MAVPDLIANRGWYTTSEAAEELGLSRQTITTAIRDGQLIAHRVGPAERYWAIKPKDLRAFARLIGAAA